MCQDPLKTKVPAQISSGDNRTRTCDPLHVKQMLSQLSYVSENYYHYIIVGGFGKRKMGRGQPQAPAPRFAIYFCVAEHFSALGQTQNRQLTGCRK